jgi:hypothetical protein
MAAKRSSRLSIRVRPREVERLKQLADDRDVTVAELVRICLSSVMLQDLVAVELPARKLPVEAGHV